MTDHDEAPLADQIADAIIARLSGNIISAILPAEPMQAVRGAGFFQSWFQIYLRGADVIETIWSGTGDGTLKLELRFEGKSIWHGSFQAES